MNASLPPESNRPIAARDAIRGLRASRIREVANAGFGLPDVLPFWFGESDRVTPASLREPAAQAASRARARSAESGRDGRRRGAASWSAWATTARHNAVSPVACRWVMVGSDEGDGKGRDGRPRAPRPSLMRILSNPVPSVDDYFVSTVLSCSFNALRSRRQPVGRPNAAVSVPVSRAAILTSAQTHRRQAVERPTPNR